MNYKIIQCDEAFGALYRRQVGAVTEADPALIAAALGDIARAKGMSQIARDVGCGMRAEKKLPQMSVQLALRSAPSDTSHLPSPPATTPMTA